MIRYTVNGNSLYCLLTRGRVHICIYICVICIVSVMKSIIFLSSNTIGVR